MKWDAHEYALVISILMVGIIASSSMLLLVYKVMTCR